MTWLKEILSICQEKTASNKVSRDKALNIAENSKYWELASMVYKFFDTKSALLADISGSGSGVKAKFCQINN